MITIDRQAMKIKKCFWLLGMLAVFCLGIMACGDGTTYQSHMEDGKNYLSPLEKDPDTARAVESFTLAIDKEPEQAEAWYYRGRAYTRDLDCRNATQDFTQAISLDPDLTDAWFRRALCTMAMEPQNYTKMEKDITRVLELEPDHGKAKMLILVIESAKNNPMD